jgi:hypothetical protein
MKDDIEIRERTRERVATGINKIIIRAAVQSICMVNSNHSGSLWFRYVDTVKEI